jgi:hypothetical protein
LNEKPVKKEVDALQTHRLSSGWSNRFVILYAVVLFLLIDGISSAKEPAATGPCGDAARSELARAIASGDAEWAAAILEQNQTVCGGYEYYFRARVITALMSGGDLPEAGSEEILRHVLDYVERIASRSAGADPLDSAIRDRARRLRPQFAHGSERHLYAILYSGDDLEEFSALLWSLPRPDCPLREALWQHEGALRRSIRRVQAAERRARQREARGARYPGAGFVARLGTGYWRPAGPLERFGPHLVVDDVVGYHWGGTEIDLATSIRFLPSRDSYQIEIDGTALKRRDFLGLYAGAEIGLAVLAYDRLTAILAGGAGMDVLAGPNEKKYDFNYTFSGLVVRAGLIMSYRLKQPYSLFADLRYNRYWYFGGFVDGERHGQDLDGGAFSAVLGIVLKLETRP